MLSVVLLSGSGMALSGFIAGLVTVCSLPQPCLAGTYPYAGRDPAFRYSVCVQGTQNTV